MKTARGSSSKVYSFVLTPARFRSKINFIGKKSMFLRFDGRSVFSEWPPKRSEGHPGFTDLPPKASDAYPAFAEVVPNGFAGGWRFAGVVPQRFGGHRRFGMELSVLTPGPLLYRTKVGRRVFPDTGKAGQ